MESDASFSLGLVLGVAVTVGVAGSVVGSTWSAVGLDSVRAAVSASLALASLASCLALRVSEVVVEADLVVEEPRPSTCILGLAAGVALSELGPVDDGRSDEVDPTAP